MAAVHYQEAPVTHLPDGGQRRLGSTDHLMMVVIDFPPGPQAEPAPPHSHPHEQVTYVAEGEVLFFLEGLPTRLAAGDMFTIPAGLPHTVQCLSERVRLVDCFTPIREDFLK